MTYRPSLIAGDSVTGVWQEDNIVAKMLRSWVALGMAPSIDAAIDLVPVDYVSQAIVRGVVQGMPEGVHVAHLNNPRPVAVREMIDWMNECGYRIDTAPYPAWRAAMVSRSVLDPQMILTALGPLFALQLSEEIDWLAHIPRFACETTRHALGGVACPPIDAALFRTYVAHLQQVDCLPGIAPQPMMT
ncbi:MAG: SDR family oxidoreductase [Anaerolineales bacterium]|nr:SDR family oxidoreductase [Anaerolineales bacterium]